MECLRQVANAGEHEQAAIDAMANKCSPIDAAMPRRQLPDFAVFVDADEFGVVLRAYKGGTDEPLAWAAAAAHLMPEQVSHA